MAEILRIFVSATNDLEPERGLIGRMVADLPVQIGIEIRRSPASGVSYETMHELISNCDRVYFLLGQDITAPAGVEWHLAWQLERAVLPLRRAGALTPAAQAFLRAVPLEWLAFRSHAQLAWIVGNDLIGRLLHATNRYGLSLTEIELLELRRRELRAHLPADMREPGGAQGGGVLLDKLGREPAGGILVDE